VTSPTSAVSDAIGAVRANFTDTSVQVIPDGAGGAYVIVDDVEVGPRYTPSRTWLGFQISSAYPDADIYPHYIGSVARVDGAQHQPPVTPTTWQGRSALQLSRKSNQWNPKIDNAANKAERILQWLVDQ